MVEGNRIPAKSTSNRAPVWAAWRPTGDNNCTQRQARSSLHHCQRPPSLSSDLTSFLEMMPAGVGVQQLREFTVVAEDLGSVPVCGSKPPVTSVPGALVPSAGLSGFCTHMVQYTTQAKTHAQNKNYALMLLSSRTHRVLPVKNIFPHCGRSCFSLPTTGTQKTTKAHPCSPRVAGIFFQNI